MNCCVISSPAGANDPRHRPLPRGWLLAGLHPVPVPLQETPAMSPLFAAFVLVVVATFYLLVLILLALMVCHFWLELKERLEERRRVRLGGRP